MKLEVGMYVRFKNGLISKISKIEIDGLVTNYYLDNEEIYNWVGVFKKASHNIIDLIEVGDYVNGKRVDLISTFEDDYYIKGEGTNGFEIDYEHQKDIKSIVTKEQFESMSYKVGE